MSLLYIGEQITIYIGSFFFIVGVIRNGINILVFLTVKNYRKTPSTFYFLIASITNIIYIIINLISRLVSVSTGYDLTRTSSVWCKTRQFSLSTLCIISLTCCCLATIDQFFVTSPHTYFRRLSSIKWAHRILIIMIIIWCLHGIIPLVAFDISSITKICGFISNGYNIYALIYFLGLITSIPVTIMAFFAYLTHRNISITIVLARQRADHQLRRMIIIQILLVILGFIPYGINSAYSLITSNINKDKDQLIKEYFILIIFSLLPYLYFSGSCYMFLITSSRFRRSIKKRLFIRLGINRIIPLLQRLV